MKIAVGLFGKYDKTVFRNNFTPHEVHYYGFSFEAIPQHTRFNAVHYEQRDPHKVIHNYTKATLYKKRAVLNDYCIRGVVEMIQNTDIAYDVVILTTFRHILLEIPQETGYYISFLNTPTSLSYSKLESIEVLSNEYVRYNDKSVQSFYTLGTSIRRKFFEQYFEYNNNVTEFDTIAEIESDITFLIPSAISVTKEPFNYVNYRSVFTPETRLLQTIDQVKSVLDLNRGIKTIVLEGTRINLHHIDQLSEHTIVVLCCLDNTANEYANVHRNKSIYEVYVIEKMLHMVNSHWVFKFGGRYKLLPSFDLELFIKQQPVFKEIEAQYTFTKVPNVEAVLYSIPCKYFEQFKNIYAKLIKIFDENESSGIEQDMYSQLIEHRVPTRWINALNIVGYDGIQANLNFF